MNDKIVYLPNIKKKIEKISQEINELMKYKKFEYALKKMEELDSLKYESIEINLHKLFCLSELHRWRDMEVMSEDLLGENSSYFSTAYYFYYILSLYQQAEYELLVEEFDEKIKDLEMPASTFEKIMKLYKESKEIIEKKSLKINQELQLAILSENGAKQWQLFHQWYKLKEKSLDIFPLMLEDERVNPFVKTKIINVLIESEIKESIKIVKGEKTIILQEVIPLSQDKRYMKTIKELEEIDQNNPSLYGFIMELLERYLDYIYPFLYEKEEIEYVSHALILLAQKHLEGIDQGGNSVQDKIKDYVKDIERANEAYFHLHLI